MSDSTPTARRRVISDADAIRYSSSAVFPIPASPRSTKDLLSLRRTSANNPSSKPRSSALPSKELRRPNAAPRPSISPHRS